MQPGEALAQRLGFLAPGQQRRARARARRRGWRGRRRRRRRRQQALGKHDGAEPLRLAHPHGALARGRSSVSPRVSMRSAERGADVVLADRRGRGDAGVLRLALQIGDDQERLAGQRIGRVEHARRGRWRARSARARRAPWRRGPARHGCSEARPQSATRWRAAAGFAPAGLLRASRSAKLARRHRRAAIARARKRDSRRSRSALSPPSPRSVSSTASMRRLDAHAPDLAASATMCASRTGRASRRIAAPAVGDAARRRRCASSARSSARASASAGAGGGSRKARLARIGDAEGGAVEQQAGQVGLEDFRRREGRQRRRLLGAPQPDRDARLRAAGAAGALVGGGALTRAPSPAA